MFSSGPRRDEGNDSSGVPTSEDIREGSGFAEADEGEVEGDRAARADCRKYVSVLLDELHVVTTGLVDTGLGLGKRGTVIL